MRDFIYKTILSGGYVGYIPFIPGTCGTLAGLIIYLFVYRSLSGWHQILFAGAGILFLTILSLALGNWAEQYYGKKDPAYFIIDEITGFFCAVIFIDLNRNPLLLISLAFVIFRLFDIIKPFPARHSQKLPGGLGIIVDDLIAGIYTNLLLQLICYFLVQQ